MLRGGPVQLSRQNRFSKPAEQVMAVFLAFIGSVDNSVDTLVVTAARIKKTLQ